MSNALQPFSVQQQIERAHKALRPGGNPKDAVAALSEALKQAPRDVGLILFLGDAHHASNEFSEAGHAYRIALRLASQINLAQIPQGIQQAMRRAEARCDEYKAGYETYLRSRLHRAPASARFEEAVEILLGQKEIYTQQPTKLYFPGLPQIQFYNKSLFDWAEELEAKTDAIRSELLNIMSEDGAFSPYLPDEDTSRPHLRSTPLQGSEDWAAFYLWKEGERVEENIRKCPITARAFEKVPLDFLPGQAPSILFSRLKPGAHIPPHTGLVNTRLIGHLPLIVPGHAWLRVGNQVHRWREGELVVFDDSIEHEAKNEAAETRIVLLFDFWRPEITHEERELITTLVGAITDYTHHASSNQT